MGVASTSVVGNVSGRGIESEYSSVVNVAEEGADRSGEESVSPVVQDVIEDDTLLKFPSGRYYMDEQVRFTGFDKVGLAGEDATLVPADYHTFDGPRYRLFRLGTADRPGRDVRVEHFAIDQRADETGIRAFDVVASDRMVVRDVDVVGYHDSGTWGPGRFSMTESSGQGLVEGLRAPDGAAWETETPGDLWRGPTGILTNQNEGTLRFKDCVVTGFPDNGLYASGRSGRVIVEGGRFRNNGPINVRIGARRGRIDGAEVTIDERSENYAAQAPIRLDYGNWFRLEGITIDMPRPNGDAIKLQNGVGGAVIRDTSISIGDRPTPGVTINPEVGPTYFANVDIDLECSANAIQILGDDPGEVIVQGGRISGGGDGRKLRNAIRVERDRCEFRGVTMDQWGGHKRRGIVFNGRDGLLYQCKFRATDRPVTVNGTDTWIQDCYLDSYSAQESICLNDSASSVRIKNNELPDGVTNRGASDVNMTGNH